ncbi:surface-adhesin E family protein [Epilithonimonas lactis]|uniref:Surface-adhesin protein E-like domain-containing protein n=1 Tax=Epilithonimonas lactis TaxID=421072 RepID=A0A085BFR8_9FLAO|nr:hypothetical protein [Epilithonimonas lactis]KFC21313.1 hypothetical protein IO89_14050 [Epilithonimonas lactis]SEP80869.1 hypothetical protein SAMN04488097_0714 [Epilithonimonas lactis]
MKKILLLLSIFVCTLSYAQDWKPIFEAEDIAYYYKPQTKNTAWIKEVSDKTEYEPEDSLETKVIKGYQITLWKFDCDDKKISPIQINVYSTEGKPLQSVRKDEDETEMLFVIPDSAGEGFFGVFCGKGKQ